MPIRYTTGSGGSGIATPPYRYTQERELILQPDTRTLLVEATPKPINRELVILCDRQIDVFWEENSQIVERIYPNFPHVNHDGGMQLYGISSVACTVKVITRQDKPFADVEEELMIPLNVSLHYSTGSNYPHPDTANDWNDYSGMMLTNLSRLMNSDDGFTGFKMFDINSFYPYKEYEFTIQIDPNGDGYDPNFNIQMQCVHPLQVLRILAEVAGDVVNPEIDDLPGNFVGRLTKDSFVGGCPGIGGKLKGKFDFSRHVGRFVAVSPTSESYDTAIIKEYIPDSDPTKAGTFVLTGGF